MNLQSIRMSGRLVGYQHTDKHFQKRMLFCGVFVCSLVFINCCEYICSAYALYARVHEHNRKYAEFVLEARKWAARIINLALARQQHRRQTVSLNFLLYIKTCLTG